MKLYLVFFMLLSFSLAAMKTNENKVSSLNFNKIADNKKTISPRRKRGMSCPLERSFASDNLRSPITSPTLPALQHKSIQETNNQH